MSDISWTKKRETVQKANPYRAHSGKFATQAGNTHGLPVGMPAAEGMVFRVSWATGAPLVKATGPAVAPVRTASAAESLSKGDVDGHPFRGNQWTGGEGGGAEPESGDSKGSNPDTNGMSPRKFTQGVNRIARLTDENYHGEAIAAGAKMVGRPDIADAAKRINMEHIKVGHLTGALREQREAQYSKLMDHAKTVLGPKEYERFNSAF